MSLPPDSDRDPGLAAIQAAMMRLGLADAGSRYERLEGGVSSDIWKVDTGLGSLCVKRALPRLKVAAEWTAPVERSLAEMAWIEVAGAILPEAVPRLIAADREAMLFVMEYLDPARYRNWKAELASGTADAETARTVAARLVRLHAATAGEAKVAQRFANDATFHAIRLEPYLVETARRHPDLAPALGALTAVTAATRTALVHGDVSPKNILIGPAGPVFLDAECAWYGDPAFDLAFCLNHLLLKCLWRPETTGGFLACYDALARTYLDEVGWEPPKEIEARTARLLSGLLLARIDGKSPVEYLTQEADKNRVRRVASRLLLTPPAGLSELRSAWLAEIKT